MASFNRAAQRAANQEVGKGFGGGGGGDFWHLSKQPTGVYLLRICPPHPLKNPEALVYRPIHFLEKERYGCNRSAPPEVVAKVGDECSMCDCVEYYSEINDRNPYEYERLIPNPALRETIENLRPKGNTHAFALLLEDGPRGTMKPPKPIHLIASAMSVVNALDDEGIGKGPEAIAMLTDPYQGRNLRVEKKTNKNYGSVSWDVFGSSLVPGYFSESELRDLLSSKYPDIQKTDLDTFKSSADQERILGAMGLLPK